MARKITFVRHGQTDKVKPDSARRLTDEGKAQAARLREKLGNPKFDLGLHSPMERTRETIAIIAGETVPTKAVPELMHDSSTEDGKLLDAAYAKLGYAPLKDYFEKTDPETRAALEHYGATAWQALMKAVSDTDSDCDILVVGHAVLLPLMIYMGCNHGIEPNYIREQTSRINLGECQGIWINADSEDGNLIIEMGTHCELIKDAVPTPGIQTQS